MDKSNGYEANAARFIEARGQGGGIGASSVHDWAGALPPNACVLDLGCGSGWPISKVLLDAGLSVYGIDASPTLVKAFRQHFPHAPVVCEAVEESSFFNRTFEGIIAWGLIFLMSEAAQEKLLQKAAMALKPGGKLLFTAPYQVTSWKDILTGRQSTSLGRQRYQELLAASGLSLLEEFDDEAGNHYYHAVRTEISRSDSIKQPIPWER